MSITVDYRRVLLYGALLAGATACLMAASVKPVSPSDLALAAYLMVLAAVLQRITVPLRRGRMNLTALAGQAAAMLLPPQLVPLVGIAATAFWTPEKSPHLLTPVRGAAAAFWTALGAAVHAEISSSGGPLWLADLAVVVVISLANWIVIGLAITIFTREPLLAVLRTNMSSQWVYSFFAFGASSILMADVLRGGGLAGYAYATLVPIVASTLRSHLTLSALQPTLQDSVRQVTVQSHQLGELEAAVHDLRNVLMTANVAAADGTIEEVRPLLTEALQVSHRAFTTQAQYRFTTVELRDLLRRASVIAKPAATSKGVHLVVELPAEPAPVYGEGTLLVELLTNLLLNAIDATSRGGNVRVDCEIRRSGQRVVAVRDGGRGFKPGLTLEATAYAAARRGPGHGIGLRWSQGVAAQHLGRLKLESSTSTGSTVVLRLPEPREAQRRLASLQA